MKSIEERASLAAQQIFEEIGISKHSVDRVSEIVAEKMREQKAIESEKAKNACNKTFGWLSTYPSCESWYNELFEEFIKNMEE